MASSDPPDYVQLYLTAQQEAIDLQAKLNTTSTQRDQAKLDILSRECRVTNLGTLNARLQEQLNKAEDNANTHLKDNVRLQKEYDQVKSDVKEIVGLENERDSLQNEVRQLKAFIDSKAREADRAQKAHLDLKNQLKALSKLFSGGSIFELKHLAVKHDSYAHGCAERDLEASRGPSGTRFSAGPRYPPIITFNGFVSQSKLVVGLRSAGVVEFTNIQKVWARKEKSRKNIVLTARSGTKRSFAWAITIFKYLVRLFEADGHHRRPQRYLVTAVVVVPTGEAGLQLKEDLGPLADSTGVKVALFLAEREHFDEYRDLNSMEVDIAIVTVGKFADILRKNIIAKVNGQDRYPNDLANRKMSIKQFFGDVRCVVVEEGNSLDSVQMLAIQSFIRGNKHTYLWFVDGSKPMGSWAMMKEVSGAITVEVAPERDELFNVQQYWHDCENKSSCAEIIRILETEPSLRTVIVARTRDDVDAISKQLASTLKLAATTTPSVSRGGIPQNDRRDGSKRFQDAETTIHVCTPLLVNGLRNIDRIIFDGILELWQGEGHCQPESTVDAYLNLARRAGLGSKQGQVITLFRGPYSNSTLKSELRARFKQMGVTVPRVTKLV